MGSIWDLNLRFAWDVSHVVQSELRPRLLLDVFHVGSTRGELNRDQVRTFGPGAENNPNPTFGQATSFQPPMSARVGLELSF